MKQVYGVDFTISVGHNLHAQPNLVKI
jgi:hypothetical protein